MRQARNSGEQFHRTIKSLRTQIIFTRTRILNSLPQTIWIDPQEAVKVRVRFKECDLSRAKLERREKTWWRSWTCILWSTECSNKITLIPQMVVLVKMDRQEESEKWLNMEVLFQIKSAAARMSTHWQHPRFSKWALKRSPSAFSALVASASSPLTPNFYTMMKLKNRPKLRSSDPIWINYRPSNPICIIKWRPYRNEVQPMS